MQYTKSEIFKLIAETTSEIGEMAQKKMGEAEQRPVFVQQDTRKLVIGKKKFLKKVPHHQIGWLLNDEVAVIYVCEDPLFKKFEEENADILEQLEEQFGPNAGFTNKTMPCAKPRVKSFEVERIGKYKGMGKFLTPDTRQGPVENPRDARNWILRGGNFTMDGAHESDARYRRGLYQLIENNFGIGEVAMHLAKCGIPSIKAGDKSREHQNNHGEISNNVIEYGTHHYFLYNSVEDFIKSVYLREKGDADELTRLSTHLARLYIKKRPKWDPKKMSKDEYLGLTPIYKLDMYGLKEMNPELTVRLDFKIYGSLNTSNNTYFWRIEFLTRFGEKTKEQFALKKFTVDKDLVVTKQVNFKPKYTFDDQHPALYQPEIYKGLLDTITEMKAKILAIDPLSSVDLISLKPDVALSENQLEKAVKEIIKEIK